LILTVTSLLEEIMHHFMGKLARLLAVLGGLVLSFLIIMTCLSITGRALSSMLHSDIMQSFMPGIASMLLATGVGPINGDFELVEAGLAFAIFAFIPLCQIDNAHASVDIFISHFPRLNRKMQIVIDIIFAVVLILIALKLYEGMQSKYSSGQTTLLLQLPVWWAYAVSLLGAVIAALVAVYIAAVRLTEAFTGRQILPLTGGASH
jgi:TRAP-type C4-dicarboxylate transport system permease small subunit